MKILAKQIIIIFVKIYIFLIAFNSDQVRSQMCLRRLISMGFKIEKKNKIKIKLRKTNLGCLKEHEE